MEGKPLRILIVEDEGAHAAAIRRAFELNRAATDIKVVGTLREFRDSVFDSLPDVALVDLVLPDGRALEILTQPPEDNPFPVLVMTSHGNEQLAVEAIKSGALDYVVKSPEAFAAMPRSVERLWREWNLLKKRQQAEEAYKVLINNAPMGIFLVQEGKFKMLNPGCEKTTGFPARELIGTNSLSLVHRDYREMVRRKATEMLKGKSDRPYEFPIRTKSGEPIWVMEKVISTVYQGNRATLGYFLDISEHKKLESQLRQAQKMEAVARLAGGVAHDFNNMLGVILGHVEIAKMRVSVTEPLHHNLQEIHKAAERSANLTRQLLAFARRQTVQPQVLDLNETSAGMLQMLHRLIGEDIDLVWVPGHDLWNVKIDPSQIDQILANLAVNSRDAIGGVGKITIETNNAVIDEEYCSNHQEVVSGKYVLLAVSDDGCGMDQETLAQIFEPFYTTKGVGEGIGLGLATVYGIIKQNDGFINLYSEPGHGTTFKIYLPRCQAEDAQDRAETAEKPFSRGSETVLIVEDEKSLIEFGKEVLEHLGYTVLIAATPGEAIRLVGEHVGDIHLLITDVVLPEMNGHELAQLLITKMPRLKCLYMSGYTANVIAHRGVLDAGVNFIQKPFSVKTLAAKVREVLGS